MKMLHVAVNGGDLAGRTAAVEEEDAVVMMEEVGREIWLGHENGEDDDSSLFYGDLPNLPDFPCMSSSSSSSTSPAPVNAIVSSASSSSTAASSSSSSAASWAVLKSDGEDPTQYGSRNCDSSADVVVPALQSTASMEIQGFGGDGGGDCMDMMETFGYMDLLDGTDFFDTSAIFSQEDDNQDANLMEQALETTQQQQQQQQLPPIQVTNNGGVVEEDMQMNSSLEQDEDLATVFLEWLKTNKETVSAEDLRKVKIKKATIESAARRLGGGKEAMKQLLKLILEWVQTNHLQRRRNNGGNLPYPLQQSYQDPFTSQADQTWPPPPLPPQTQAQAPQAFVSDPGFTYMAAAQNYPPQDYLPLLESPPSWAATPPPQFPMAAANSHYNPFQEPTSFTGYNMNPYSSYPPYLPGQMRDQRLLRLCSSATKEARKKRMARQRRFLSHHHRHNTTSSTNNNNQQSQNQMLEHARVGESCGNVVATQLNQVAAGAASGGTWMYWPNVPANVAPPGSAQMESQLPNMDRTASVSAMTRQQVVPDRRQGWKPEKNLRFLLQKVLKQSDVGNLGRIVLPKKEAETHLPELEARDGISLAMEDIGTSRVWNMRYRFWPNNKSRMYLLENTGDFVKTNGLQEGDFIVIYSDVKCGKYLIRGVKVRQPAGTQKQTEAPTSSAAAKRQSKSQRNNINHNSPSANMMMAAPTTQAVK